MFSYMILKSMVTCNAKVQVGHIPTKERERERERERRQKMKRKKRKRNLHA